MFPVRNVVFALRVMMESVFTSVRLKVAVLLLITIQLKTGESVLYLYCVFIVCVCVCLVILGQGSFSLFSASFTVNSKYSDHE